MGQKNRRKAAFLLRHPRCCFCGGAEQAVEVDHTPSRSFFVERDWPLSYEFPACEKCNRSAGLSEAVCAAIARMGGHQDFPNAELRASLKEGAELFQAVAQRDPDFIKEFFGVERVNGLVTSPLIAARLQDESGNQLMFLGTRFYDYFKSFVEKMIRALYYKHTGNILAEKADIKVKTFSNAQKGQLDERSLARIELPKRPFLQRASQSRSKSALTEQFDYSYYVDSEGKAMFKIRFHQMFLMAAFVNCVDSIPTLTQADFEAATAESQAST